MSHLSLAGLILLIVGLFIIVLIAIGHRYNEANWGHAGANVLDGWIRLYCRKYHRQGELNLNIPKGENPILASNHISAIDPFLLISATDRPVRFMIATEEYEKPFLKWMFKLAGCIPVDRAGRVEVAFGRTLRAIRAGELVAIFPQGGFHCQSTPRHRIKKGIIKLSQMSGRSILPIRINGVSAPGTMIKSVIMRSTIRLDIHPLISTNQVMQLEFVPVISDWFLGNIDHIELPIEKSQK